MPLRFAPLALAMLVSFAAPAPAAAAILDYQDPRDDERAVRLWLPDGLARVRGVIVWGNAGTGDSRRSVHNPALQTWARNHGFGLLCTKALNFDSAVVTLDALRHFALASGHPELADAPFVALGHSNGGLVALGLVHAAPARSIAFAMNKAAIFIADLPAAALSVPGVLISGQHDLERRKTPMRRLFDQHRARGALWAFLEEQNTGHGGDSRAMDLIMPYLEQAIAMRVPPSREATGLRGLSERQGWLAEAGPSRPGSLAIFAWADYRKDPRKASWLPNEATAVWYRAVASRDRPLRLSVAKAGGGDESGAVFAAGQPLRLSLDTYGADEHWQRFEWLDGAHKLGETVAPVARAVDWRTTRDPAALASAADAPKGAAKELSVKLAAGVHGLSVLAHRHDGRRSVSAPVRVIVAGGGADAASPRGAPSKPVLTSSPRSPTISAGEVATFEVQAAAGPLGEFQWHRNGVPIPGAIFPSLRLPNQDVDADGDRFHIVARNEFGETRSAPVILRVTPFSGAVAAFTPQPPVIDGKPDAVWDLAVSHPVAHVIADATDRGTTSARFRALWDHQALYVLIEVVDDQPFGGAARPWANDTAEVFLEGSNEKAPRWGRQGFQFGLPYGAASPVEAFTGQLPRGTTASMTTRAGHVKGHTSEFRFPETALGVSLTGGLFLGFDVQVNDCASDGQRRVKLAWHGRRNDAFEAPRHLGTLKLLPARTPAPHAQIRASN